MFVFGILGIFSAKYRLIAKEAADCVFRRATLRKCESGLDKRLKNQISGKLAAKKPKLARFLHKYFEVFSWALMLLLIWSIIITGIGIYNYAKYGNCNGPEHSNDFCIFNPTGSNSQYSGINPTTTGPKQTPLPGNSPWIGKQEAKVTIIQFGCFTCPYTKKAEETMKQLIQEYENQSVKFVFKYYPLPTHEGSVAAALTAECAYKYNKYFEARKMLFDITNFTSDQTYTYIAEQLNINKTALITCVNSDETKNTILTNVEEGKKAQVYGTPTLFINNKTIVGPKDINAFRKIINEELKK